MPLYVIVQCFKCEAYQARQMTQNKKYSCAICNTNQIIQKVYASENKSTKELRHKVQQLNMGRKINENSSSEPVSFTSGNNYQSYISSTPKVSITKDNSYKTDLYDQDHNNQNYTQYDYNKQQQKQKITSSKKWNCFAPSTVSPRQIDIPFEKIIVTPTQSQHINKNDEKLTYSENTSNVNNNISSTISTANNNNNTITNNKNVSTMNISYNNFPMRRGLYLQKNNTNRENSPDYKPIQNQQTQYISSIKHTNPTINVDNSNYNYTKQRTFYTKSNKENSNNEPQQSHAVYSSNDDTSTLQISDSIPNAAINTTINPNAVLNATALNTTINPNTTLNTTINTSRHLALSDGTTLSLKHQLRRQQLQQRLMNVEILTEGGSETIKREKHQEQHQYKQHQEHAQYREKQHQPSVESTPPLHFAKVFNNDDPMAYGRYNQQQRTQNPITNNKNNGKQSKWNQFR